MIVNICGIPHEVIECEVSFDTDLHLGQIDYDKATIKVNKDLAEAVKRETLCHEMVHGILTHLGYTDDSADEKFVQQLGNAINQSFDIKWIDGKESR